MILALGSLLKMFKVFQVYTIELLSSNWCIIFCGMRGTGKAGQYLSSFIVLFVGQVDQQLVFQQRQALCLAANHQLVEEVVIPNPYAHGIFTKMYTINEPNVGKYSIHGASGQSMAIWIGYVQPLFFRSLED